MNQSPILVVEGYCRFPSWRVQAPPNVTVQVTDDALYVTDGDLTIDVRRTEQEREEHHYVSVTHYWYSIMVTWKEERKADLYFENQFQLHLLPERNWVLKTRHTATAETRMSNGYGTELKTVTINARNGRLRRFDEQCQCKAERLALQGCRQCLTLKVGELLMV